MTKFGTEMSRMSGRGHWVLGLTLGYDNGLFATVGLIKWLLVIGWCDWEREDGLAEYERQSHRVVMRRDYYDEAGSFRVATNRQHDPESDLPTHFLYDTMLEAACIRDGDEYEILITATDRRPHGDRRWVSARDGGTFLGSIGNFRAETDQECLRRIETTGGGEEDGDQEQPREI